MDRDYLAPGSPPQLLPLGTFPVLRRLEPTELATLAARTVTRQYRRGEFVAAPVDGVASIAAIRRGAVRLLVASSEGKEAVLATFGGGDLIEAPGRHPAQTESTLVKSLEDEAVLSFLPGRPFLDTAALNPEAASELVVMLWHRGHQYRETACWLFFSTVRSRVAETILDLAERDSLGAIRATQDEIALLAGTARDKVTKFIQEFCEAGWIEHKAHSHEVRVLDGLRLARAAGRTT